METIKDLNTEMYLSDPSSPKISYRVIVFIVLVPFIFVIFNAN
ncbi:hypothetical protein ELS84_1633 [Enterococcus faecalis]|nr:hypothetical protein ELS84_1633 [Enterococcus faecalis]OSH23770.1 hypothetical protein EFNM313_1949 [Enterococcus faecalis]